MFTSENATEMANKGVEKRRNKKEEIHNHMQRMRDYKFDCDTIDSMELSTLIHTIPITDDSIERNTNNSKTDHDLHNIYKVNVTQLSKRGRKMHRNTINLLNTNHNKEKKQMDRILHFMTITNRPHSVQSAIKSFGSKNGISNSLMEVLLSQLVQSNQLQSKQFENGQTLYWIAQNDIEYTHQITEKEKELQHKICMLSCLQQERYQLELENKKIEYEKYFTIWTHRKAKTFEMIDTLFDTFDKSPSKILTKQIKGETDIDNNVEFARYEFLFKQLNNMQ
eukprot:424907_1